MKGLQAEDIRVHEKNWFDCIRSGKQPNAGIDLAIRVDGHLVVRNGRALQDHLPLRRKTRKVTTADGKEAIELRLGKGLS